MSKRLLPLAAAVALVAVLLLGPVAGSSAPVRSVATSQGFGIRIAIPGQAVITQGYVSAPNDSSGTLGGYAYPDDGSVLTSGAMTLSATSASTATPSATASVEVNGITLFGGEVTIALVDAKVSAAANSTSGGVGSFSGTNVSGIGGSAVAGSALGTWGTISTSSGLGSPSTGANGEHGWHGSVGAVDIHLITDHNGLPAGTDIQIGYAAASVTAEPVETRPTTTAQAPTTTEHTTTATTTQTTTTTKKKPKSPLDRPIGPIPTVHPTLTAGRYVFPVYGDSAYGNTFGAARADVAWHHGDDIFAPLGAPILAVADGTVFSVGWNKIGGWRLWLRDRAGNEFYYAHLSAYSPYALNNAQVRAGTVLGFVGNTGDAEGTPYHLHFEIHPVQLLGLGYDGVVNPTPYLDAWKRLQDISFSSAGAWLPGLVRLTSTRAPEPGAILLQISDISSASGLDPGSLRRAMAPVVPVNAAPADEQGLSASANAGDLGRG